MFSCTLPYLSRERWEVLSTSKLAVLIDFFQTEIGLWNKLIASLVVHHRFSGENHCYKSREFHRGMCLWTLFTLFHQFHCGNFLCQVPHTTGSDISNATSASASATSYKCHFGIKLKKPKSGKFVQVSLLDYSGMLLWDIPYILLLWRLVLFGRVCYFLS